MKNGHQKSPFGYDKNPEINMLFVWKHFYCICLFANIFVFYY